MAKRILLVEDEPGLQLTLSDRLRSEGYEVETASDGETGYELATEETFDLIILDIMLPGKNGFDVCRDLRQIGTTQPILMLTARGYDVTPSTRTVDVHIARLRQKIETNPKYPVHILTVHGMGYKFIG